MSLACETDKCMFFVGGADVKANNNSAGVTYAGGCTKTWWDAEVAASDAETAMSKLMDTDGSAKFTTTTTVHTDHGDNTIRITSGDTGVYSDIEAGMLVYHYDESVNLAEGEGIYKILEVDNSFNYIVIDTAADGVLGVIGDSDGNTIAIGGAFDDLDALLTSYIDGEDYSQEIWVNKDFTKTAVLTTVSWGDGNILKNTWLKIRGFNRTPWDMHPGGAYYQSALDKLISGLSSTAAVDFDFDQTDCHGLLVDGSVNYVFECMNWGNSLYDNAADKAGVYRQNNPENIIFNHCSATGGRSGFLGHGKGVIFYDCYADVTGYTPATSGYGFRSSSGTDVFTVYDNCIAKGASSDEVFYCYDTCDIFINCLAVNGDRGISAPRGGKQYIRNCTLYNQSVCSIRGGSLVTNGLIVVKGNINLPTDQSDLAYELHTSGGSIREDYNNNYSLAGALSALGNNPYSGGQITEEGQNSLQVDPLLDGGYRSRNKNVLLGGTEIGGQKATIGAISQEHQFVGRSGNSNPGRLGIIR